VDFKNTVVIMTSNLGSDVIGRRALGFGAAGGDGGSPDDQQLRDRIMQRLRESFRPEFLNRIDEIIIFRHLDETQLRQITSLLLEETRRRLHAQAITVEFTTEAIDWLARRGFHSWMVPSIVSRRERRRPFGDLPFAAIPTENRNKPRASARRSARRSCPEGAGRRR
jgi:ATP-dependent Clp protease ATP-binding subunit ClpA